MNELDKTLHYNELFHLYQNLLTPTQKEILSDYYIYDLSITEISEIRGISRAAVEDAIKKGTIKLDKYESELKFSEKNEKLQNLLNKMKNTEDLAEIKKIVKELEEVLKNGIWIIDW